MPLDNVLVQNQLATTFQQLRTRTLQVSQTVTQLVTDANKFLAKATLAKEKGFIDDAFDADIAKVQMLVNAPQVQELLTLIAKNITDPLAG